MEPRKLITRTLERVGHRHGMRQVWEDWIEGLALAFANALGNRDERFKDDAWRAREDRYLRIVRRYGPEEWREVAGLTGPAAAAAQAPGDLLGELYMSLEFGNDRAGQFFTPWHLCLVNARLLVGDAEQLRAEVARRGYITVDDPACGSATMLFAFAEVCREAGIDPHTEVWFHGTDISSSAVHLAYVNLALRGLPAQIVHGNTLTLETFGTWETPAHTLAGWPLRLSGAEPPLARIVRLLSALVDGVPGPAPTDHPDHADPPDDHARDLTPSSPAPASDTSDTHDVTATAPASPPQTPETPVHAPAAPPAQLSLL